MDPLQFHDHGVEGGTDALVATAGAGPSGTAESGAVESGAVENDWRRLLATISRKKPTPKMAPSAIWVDDTGKPRAEAMRTVIAAERATQKARERSSLVIFSPTTLISFGP